MDSYDYAKKLVEEFGVREDDALHALHAEVDDRGADARPRAGARRPRRTNLLEDAYDTLHKVLREPNLHLSLKTDAERAAFVLSHRRGPAWATFIGRALRSTKKHEEAPK